MKRTLLIGALLLIAATQPNWGQIPQTMSYQGVLKDGSGNLVANGNYSLTFKLYDGTNAELWTETQPSVAVINGIFNAILGSVNPLSLSFDKPYFLGVTVGTGSELIPKIPLTASAYSLKARSVADGQVVKSINSLKDDVVLAAGSNITITPNANTLTIAAVGGSGGGGSILQSEYSRRQSNGPTSSTTTFVEYHSMSFTPQSTSSKLRIFATFDGFQSGNTRMDVKLMRDSIGLTSRGVGSSQGTNKSELTFVFQENSPGTSPVSYRIVFRKEPGSAAGDVIAQYADILVEEILFP